MRYLLCTLALLMGISIAYTLHRNYTEINPNTQRMYHSEKRDTITLDISKAKEPLYWKSAFRLFLHNVLVGLLLSIGGLFTAGSLTILVMAYNGFLATSILLSAYQNQSAAYIISHLWHGPFEIVALIWYGGIGLNGTKLLVKFLNKESITFDDFHPLKRLIEPTVLLLIAALIEAML